jgi:hypothetical protein
VVPPFATSLDASAAIVRIAFLVIGALNILIVHLLREERELSSALAKRTRRVSFD